jgi:cob(I)alamin adenosyltransferase
MKGYTQVYTGTGKGKTTAALGLALRAAGAGLKVYFGQFIKKGNYCEIRALKKLAGCVTVRQCGRGCFIRGKPSPRDIETAMRGFEELRAAAAGGGYDVVIADELSPAVSAGLIGLDEVLRLVDEKPAGVELVITGRGAHPRLVKRADLVTDMRCVKHYMDAGVRCRKGIEC